MSVKISRDEIITILRLVEQSSCEDFELNIGDTSLRVRKRVSQPEPVDRASQVAAPPPPAPTGQQGVDIGMQPTPVPKEPSASSKPRDIIDGFQLKAPMLGIFYRSSAPGAPPFVEVGQTIAAGTTLCIIEVMKVMNTVKADRSGVIAAIYPENAAMVEFGETIMVIRAETAA